VEKGTQLEWHLNLRNVFTRGREKGTQRCVPFSFFLPQNGSHPTEYHEFVLANMERAAEQAGSNKEKFLRLFNEYVVEPVSEHPEMLDKAFWQP